MPVGSTLTTIQCPKCGHTILGMSIVCQFCGTQIQAAPRARTAFLMPADDKKTWQEIAYYVLAAIWVLYGAFEMLQGFGVIPSVWQSMPGPMKGGPFIGTIGGVFVLMGIGLLFETGWVQFLTKIVCWLGIGVNIMFLPMVLLARHPGLGLLNFLLFIGIYSLQIHVIATVGDA